MLLLVDEKEMLCDSGSVSDERWVLLEEPTQPTKELSESGDFFERKSMVLACLAIPEFYCIDGLNNKAP